MYKVRDAYQIIGTSKIAIERDINDRKRTEEEKDKFILEKADQRIKFLDFEYSTIANEEKRNLNRVERRSVIIAYETIKDEESRKAYDEKMDQAKKIDALTQKPFILDAYSIIGISREKCLQYEDKEHLDELIKQEYERKIHFFDEMIEKRKDDFKFTLMKNSEKEKFTEAYEKIKNEDSRKAYNLELDLKKKRAIQERENRYLQEKYDKSDKYNPKLILDNPGAISKKNIDGAENIFYDENGNEVKIRKTGEISYVTFAGVFKSDIGEYQVIRTIDNEENEFIVYSNISIFNMSIDKNGNPIIDPEYYTCVMQELLSEESLKGNTRYNQGYLGEVLKKPNGSYYVHSDVEELAAVYKFTGYKRQQNLEDRSN